MVGTAVTPGLGARVRRVALRLVAVGGLAVLAWLLGVLLNSGTASAAQNSTIGPGTPHSTDGTDSGTGGGLLGGLLGGLGNTLGNVTGTVSGITTTVTNVTTGLVSGVTTTLGTTVQTVTGIVAPATTQVVTTVTSPVTSPGGSASGSTTHTVPVAAEPVQHQSNAAIPAAASAAPAPPAVPAAGPQNTVAVVSHKVIPVAAQRIAVPVRHIRPASRPLPDQPAPQPAPTPGIPVSLVSAGHGFQGSIRHTLGTPVPHDTAPSRTAFGVHAPDPAAQAARDQGLPPTTPD